MKKNTISLNDLSQHNFLCDRKTGKVRAIIDWEFAGFYPSFFEAPLCRAPYYEIEDDLTEIGQLLYFLEPTTKVTEVEVSNFGWRSGGLDTGQP